MFRYCFNIKKTISKKFEYKYFTEIIFNIWTLLKSVNAANYSKNIYQQKKIKNWFVERKITNSRPVGWGSLCPLLIEDTMQMLRFSVQWGHILPACFKQSSKSSFLLFFLRRTYRYQCISGHIQFGHDNIVLSKYLYSCTSLRIM